MQRKNITPRPHWQERCEQSGFFFHSVDEKYWVEDYCYEFEQKEIELIENCSNELHQMSLDVLSDIIKAGDYLHFYLSDKIIAEIESSWPQRHNNYIYSRFDLSYQNMSAKLLEYNADTPTTLLEAAIVQQNWTQDRNYNSFNNLDSELVARWKVWAKNNPLAEKVFFTTVSASEDVQNGLYMMDCCIRAGLQAEHILIQDIGFDQHQFLSLSDEIINYCFKVYPWEWMQTEEFFGKTHTSFIEPAWKVLLNKPILPYLWKKFKNHPNLLASYFSIEEFYKHHATNSIVVEKRLYGREGENVSILQGSNVLETVKGTYTGNSIYQEYCPLPEINGRWPMVGSWIVGDKACGIGIRDDYIKITKNSSWFVPHCIR